MCRKYGSVDKSVSLSDGGNEPVGKCPKCASNVYEHGTSYVCEKSVGADKSCDFRSGKVILQQSVSQAVTAIRLSGESMSACTEESEQARQAMDAISTALQHIADMSSQIAAAAEQQQSTSAEIARNLNNINQIADQNQQEIDKVAQTSGQLQQLSASQQTLIHRFTL